MDKNYKKDREFLARHISLVELTHGDARVLLSPALQGRVMTSTAEGDAGYSFGWINYDLLSSGILLPHCNNFGGEDRFWLGPEGGQYALFFKPGTGYDFEEWQAPAAIDTEKWELTGNDSHRASFRKETAFLNNAGHTLSCVLERDVELLAGGVAALMPDVKIPAGVRTVAFRSRNSITNTGDFAWDKKTGMPSVWILGQFTPSARNTVVIPLRKGGEGEINDAYFGKIPADRLRVTPEALYFKGDGERRGKIGIPPGLTVPMCGAYDAENATITLVGFSFDPAAKDYVNSMWEHQADPFSGDVINSYNDGPLEDGSIMGPFYELETSSPAAALAPGQTLTHTHTTVHLCGDPEAIAALARQILGI